MFKNPKFVLWVEEYLFYPHTLSHKLLSYALLPISFLYCAITLFKRYRGKKKRLSFGIPIVSVGNLTLGGNGKTPFCITLAQQYDNVAVILRGYGRKSHGML
ncbi:MAG: tetraacyldisaccharide 4'-kinase, partial [Epsilonproteobacteria bacterium]|nr:tetraacyldisaccharide 4'-kinase [Campylobacterota bacterium]